MSDMLDAPHSCLTCAQMGRTMRSGPCPGHAKKGGGDDSGKGDGSETKNDNDGLSNNIVLSSDINTMSAVSLSTPRLTLKNSAKINKEDDILDSNFDPKMIANLKKNKLLTIRNQAEIGLLSIESLSQFLSKEDKIELTKFINAIRLKLAEFVAQNNILENGFTETIVKDNKTQSDEKNINIKSMTITIANPELYEKFIKQLNENVFRFISNEDINDKEEKKDNNKQNKFHPTPLLTKLKK